MCQETRYRYSSECHRLGIAIGISLPQLDSRRSCHGHDESFSVLFHFENTVHLFVESDSREGLRPSAARRSFQTNQDIH